MLQSQRLAVRISEIRERLNTLSGLEGDAYGEAEQQEVTRLSAELQTTEQRYRAAMLAEDTQPEPPESGESADPEERERAALRNRASLTRFMRALTSGQRLDGAEAEYAQAMGTSERGIPLSMFEPRSRAVSPVPTSDTPVNAAPVVPYVFGSSLAGPLGVEVRQTGPGTYSVPRITTAPAGSAGPVAAGAAADETAAVMDVVTGTPRRLTAAVRTNVEGLWTLGEAYEDSLRQSLRMQLSAKLDAQLIEGAAAAPNLNGLITQVGLPSAARTAVVTWETGNADFTAMLDGLWATEPSDLFCVIGAEGYRFADGLYRALAGAMGQGYTMQPEASLLDHLRGRLGGFRTHHRMPARYTTGTLNNHVAFLVARRGQPDIVPAVVPIWGEMTVDDAYTSAARGERVFTLIMGVGNLIVLHSDAYQVNAWKVA